MARRISYALVVDGSSDGCLAHVVTWTLLDLMPEAEVDHAGILVRGGTDLSHAMDDAAARFRSDLLVVHRDAEREQWAVRRAEIPHRDGIAAVVPVRMTEAWLLHDTRAVGLAAGNPSATVTLPKHGTVESDPSPKITLRGLLLGASGFASGRRRRRFERDLPSAVQRVAEYIEDWSPFLQLSAYRAFRQEVATVIGVADTPRR